MSISTTDEKKCSQKQLPEVFHKKGVIKNFEKFTEKHLCQSLFFDKVAGLRPFIVAFRFLPVINFQSRGKNTYEMIQTKNLFYFKSYLINHFLYKDVFIKFPVLKGHDDNVTQMSYI